MTRKKAADITATIIIIAFVNMVLFWYDWKLLVILLTLLAAHKAADRANIINRRVK